jgi:hypothetical protein
VPRRDLVHRRSPFARWSGRLLAVLGTGAVLAAGVVAATMLLALEDDDTVSAAPVAPGGGGGGGKLTREQRAERRAAVAVVRERGYAPQDLDDYKIDHLLRVIVGEPVDDTPAGLRAFFFVDGEFIGNDASAPSRELRPGRQLEREITLVYTLPSGDEERVHFRWDGKKLEPREKIPPAGERAP